MSDNWPIQSIGGERLPLNVPEYWTPDGLYQQGYLEGKKGRFAGATDLRGVPEEFLMGLEDGHGDWLAEFDGTVNVNDNQLQSKRVENFMAKCNPGQHSYDAKDTCTKCGWEFR